MPSTAPPPPLTAPSSPPLQPSASVPKLAVPKVQFVPPRLVINAVEGWGKTTVGAYAPGSVILMAKGETGYLTLLGSKRVPERPAVLIETWDEVLTLLDSLAENDQGAKVIVLDALNGFERLCHQHVCRQDFGGVWGDKGFLSFHKGYEVAVGEWLEMLGRLDVLHGKGKAILFLSHSTIRPFGNPEGENFDRYEPDCHRKTWGVTNKWADAVLFGKFVTVLDKQGAKVKGIGGKARTLCTERSDAYDAKNRYGMAELIEIPNDHTKAWSIIATAIKGGN